MAVTVLKRIDPFSLAKLNAILYGLLGLLIGAIFALLSLFGAALGSAFDESGQAWIGGLFGVGAVFIFPIFYAIIGFISGLILSALYNLAAGMGGGVQVELE
jgi:hypothetical protein